MAATASAWAKPGTWALDAEEDEPELLNQHNDDGNNKSRANDAADTLDFPSLSKAAVTKTKKKKGQTLSLQEFTTYSAKREEVLVLPTGPRERTEEELDRTKLGGGFRSYGGGRDEQPRRQGGGFNSDSSREFAPSRADETDDWGAGKKSGFERRERGEKGGYFGGDSQSRADEVDNWATKKSFVPSSEPRRERRGGFGLESGNGGGAADEVDNWAANKSFVPSSEPRRERRGGFGVESGGADSGSWGRKSGGGGAFESLRERRGGGFEGGSNNGADADTWGRKREEVSVGSVVAGGGRPRLNLQPRTLPVVVDEGLKGEAVKPKGSNPFGEARPREEVLKEKGLDWKEIEEKLESTKIKEVAPAGPAEGEKRGFWSGNGRDRERERERVRMEDKMESVWRKPESVGSRPQSASKSENGHPENTENVHAEEAEERDPQN